MKCRHCSTLLEHTFLDLGFAPPSNAYLHAEQLTRPELHYPLHVKVCDQCWLVLKITPAQTNCSALIMRIFPPLRAVGSTTRLAIPT